MKGMAERLAPLRRGAGIRWQWLAGVMVAAVVCSTLPALAIGPQVTRSTLTNGATLLVSEQHNLPMVLVRVLVDAGARRDPAGIGGVAYLTADLLTEGTATRSAAEISEAVDFIGGSLTSSAEMDYATLGLRVLAKDLDVGMDLLADVLTRPAFAGGELARRREAVLARIRAEKDQPTTVAIRAFRPALFGNEPYGHPVHGTETSVPRVTRAEIRNFYQQFYQPARTLVVVVGDITAEAARARVERALASWKGAGSPEFQYPPPTTPSTRHVQINKPVTQAAVVLGHRGIARDNPDYEPLMVMNYILGGGGFSSRLMDRIRTRAGLVYSVSSGFGANKAPGSFQIVMQTKNESVNEAIALARAEVDRLRAEPVADEELDEAKRYLTGSFPLRMDSNGEVAGMVGEFAFYDLGLDYADRYLQRMNAVTQADVQRVAQQYLRPEEFIEVIVADLDKVGDRPAIEPAP